MSGAPLDPESLARLAGWLRDATTGVAFTGAGISTESGVPDYRSQGGVWANSRPVMFDEFLRDESAREEYWRQKSLTHDEFERAQPNTGHRLLAEWQRAGRIRGVITQNIDGLHQRAGAVDVLELHGTACEVGCLDCLRRFPAEPWVRAFQRSGRAPVCPDCGGPLKHATISFGQSLDPDVLQRAVAWSKSCDLFLAIGSSLVVEPAASLPVLAKRNGARLVILNRDPTPLDGHADLVLRAEIGPTLERVDSG